MFAGCLKDDGIDDGWLEEIDFEGGGVRGGCWRSVGAVVVGVGWGM